ncbi:glycosyltransferase family 4 protein [Ciceribacter thiooxidans]|uniref:Glycosyltransferase family 4 protein n=1 Tax=Ciceribacter thiooxidans TaxID=1969821 RepID=A0ABV7I1A0_9HYPH|nr:glycosyltransferase family 4 protein [Ciceribacter thiooxidans]
MGPRKETTSASAQRSGHAPLIVQVVRQYAPGRGGLEDVVGNLSRLLLARGYRVRVVTCNSLFTDRERSLPALEVIDGVEVVRIPWSGSTRYPLAPQVLRHIRDADLVHVHAVDFFFDFLAVTRPFHGRPMVVTTHGGFFHTKKYAAIKRLWFRTLTRLSCLAYRAVVCCSRSDFDLFDTIAAGRTVLVENGVDTGKFAGLASSLPMRRMVTIGRFSVNKRLERLLDVTARLVEKDPRWHLDIIGSPSDLTEADLRREIAARGLAEHVGVQVAVPNETVRRLISDASIFVSASDYEGFGLVAVEAMSAGLLPVLNSNDAYRSLAGQHSVIRLADFEDASRASDAVEAAFADLTPDPGATRRALIKAAGSYSWDTVVEHYVTVYRDAMAE